ncbi:MAG: hypothetical protein U9R47_01125 [Actinomycetota bacterium]|nr:hypothetical protein [Actinomycetota bacterium]
MRPGSLVSLLRTPPFVRAPTLLRNHATVAVATFVAAVILGLVVSIAPLFVSSATNAALTQEISSRCAGNVNGTLGAFAPIAEADPEIARVWSQTTTLGEPILTRRSPPVEISTTGENPRKLLVRFLHRTGFEDNVEVLEQSDPGGLWISDRGADYLGAVAGDSLEMHDGRGKLVTIPVGTVYRDLNEVPRTDYWCPVQDNFIPGPPHGDLPPALVLIDRDQFLQLFPNLESPPYDGIWELPVERTGLTTQTAVKSIQEMEQMEAHLREIHSPGFANWVSIRTDLPFIVRRTAALGEVLRSSVAPIAAAAVISALGLLAAAGSYWVDRRRAEVVLLTTKGVGPGAIALKATMEMGAVVAVGTVVGLLIALAVGPAIGPAPLVDSSARWQALVFTASAAVLGLGSVAAVVGARSTQVLDETRKRWRATARIPALLFFAAAAGLAWFSLRHGAITVAQGDQAGRVGPLVLAFPFLLFGTATLLAAEVLARVIGRRRRSQRSRPPAFFLASRRIASSPTMALVLIAAAAFPTATLVYSTSLSRSSASTIETKARSFIGSDLAVAMIDDRAMPESLAGSATQVVRYERVHVGDREVDIVGVDAATFTDGAYWHNSFSEGPLEEVLALLDPPGADESLPVVVANGSISDSVVESDDWADHALPVTVTGTIASFPGMRSDRPLLIADRSTLSTWLTTEDGKRLPGFRDWIYVRGIAENDAAALFGDEDVAFAWINGADEVLDQLKYAVIIWTFDFVEIIAVLAALIAVAGMFLYGDAHQRARNLAYALARRMGLSRRSHLFAGFLELLTLLGLGLAVGASAAIAASSLIYRGIDPVPTTPPGPRLIGALDVVLVCGIVILAVSSMGALWSQRIANRADTSELLRHDG